MVKMNNYGVIKFKCRRTQTTFYALSLSTFADEEVDHLINQMGIIFDNFAC